MRRCKGQHLHTTITTITGMYNYFHILLFNLIFKKKQISAKHVMKACQKCAKSMVKT